MNLAEIKDFFQGELPEFSRTEMSLMVKLLVLKTLDISDTEYMLSQDLVFSKENVKSLKNSVIELKSNNPFQYVLGEVEFYGVMLSIDKRALIPRPETEELVDWIVNSVDHEQYSIKKENLVMLDICSGSGCIAFGIKSRFKKDKIIAGELSKDALSLIDENRMKTELDIEILELDALDIDTFSKIKKESLDIIVSNPPYIPAAEKVRMGANVLEHEPEMALFVSNENPLLFYKSIAEIAKVYLKLSGNIFFEIHEDFASEVMAILKSLKFVNIELRKDLQGKDRMVRAQKLSSQL